MNRRNTRGSVLPGGFISVLCFWSAAAIVGCKLPTGPLGSSTMSAKINGVQKTFSSIEAQDYLGKWLWGSCDSDRVDLHLGYSDGGRCTWSALHHTDFGDPDTTAYLNGSRAIPGIGGFEILMIAKGRREYSGVFEFSVTDSSGRDTIRVTDGSFDVFAEDND